METRERLVLRKNHIFLKDHIDIKTVVDSLYQSSVLNTDDKDRIHAEVVQSDKVEKLLRILPRKCKSYPALLDCVDEHIKIKLQQCEITPEEISKEDQHLDDFVRDILKELCCVEEKSKVTVSALEDEVRQQIIDSGTEYRMGQSHLQALVLSTFADVALGKSGGRRKRTAVYKNLSWRQTDLESEGNDSGDEETHASQTHSRLLIEEMNVAELCHVLEGFNPDANRLDPKILTIFKKENIDGRIFKYLNSEDTKEILPGFSFRDRKNLLIARDELIKCEKAGELDESFDRPEKEKLTVKNKERKGYFRESFRKFETPVGNLDNYRKSAVIRTSITRPHNLIEPVRLFLNKTEGEKITWIAQETVRFASACMNERTNGTIHFGVERKVDSDYLEGEIVGIEVEKDICKEAIYQAITSHFYEDQIELALKCIRPVEFIEVSSLNQFEQNLVVIEVDIVPTSTLVQDEAVYVRFEEGMVLYRFLNDDPYPSSLTEEQTRQYMKSKKELAQHRKQQEQMPKTVPIQEDLRQKFLNLFAGGCETLAEEMYPIVFLSPLEYGTDHQFEENFLFVNDIEPCVIFDFYSSSGANGLYNFIEVEKEQVVKVLTTENFDRNSEENKTDHERRNHLFDDLRTSALRPWVFAMGMMSWKKNQ